MKNRQIFFGIIFLIAFINTEAQWNLVFKDSTDWGYREICFFDENEGLLIGTSANANGSFILHTNDGGQNWDTTYFVNKWFRGMDFPSLDTGYIVYFENFTISVMRTVDHGQNWVIINGNINVGSPIYLDIDFFDKNTGVISTGGYSWKTTDAGINWNLITSNPVGGGEFNSVEDSILIGGGGSYYMYYSFDSSITYDTIIFCNNSTASSFHLKNGIINIGGTGQDGSNWGYGHINYGIIVLSDISDLQFTIIHFPYPQMYGIRTVFKTDNFYYAGGWPFNDTIGSHFLKSPDGINWFRQESSEVGGISIPSIENIFCVNDTICFAYGSGNIYKTTNGGGAMLQQVGVLINDVKEIEDTQDISIYPNPFTNGITIESSNGNISSIKIFDITGKLIKVTYPLSQRTVIDLDIERGVYLVQIEVSGKLIQHKITKM